MNKKWIIGIIFLLILLSTGVYFLITNVGYKPIFYDEFVYGFDHPKNWEMKNEEGNIDFQKTTKTGLIAHIYVNSGKNPRVTNLNEVKELYRKYYQNDTSTFTIINEEDIEVNGVKGYEITTVTLDGGEEYLKSKIVTFMTNKDLEGFQYMYEFRYLSPADSYYKYEETFDHMINSFYVK